MTQNQEYERARWREIPQQALGDWNARLLQTDAPLSQYPYWNEPFRAMYFTPRYLVYGSSQQSLAYVCILSVGIPGMQIGLVQRGPVRLIADPGVWRSALPHLGEWAKAAGYVFLRFTHSDTDLLTSVAAVGTAEEVDAFPLYRDHWREELIVEQREDDTQMLGSFQTIARRKIKKSIAFNYDISVSDSPEALHKVWPLFASLAERKTFQYRPMSSYMEMMRLAQPYACVRLYVASLAQQPVAAILIVRDRTTAYYISGALDVVALGDNPSPACQLHWYAMRDFFQLGVKYYHLGTRSGEVYQFKRQFRPLERVNPPPLTLVINTSWYRLWSAAILRLALPVWPRIKATVFR
ncbi:MAG: GNAT family N-acetyltransferase [Candidatus Binatia bacterium]